MSFWSTSADTFELVNLHPNSPAYLMSLFRANFKLISSFSNQVVWHDGYTGATIKSISLNFSFKFLNCLTLTKEVPTSNDFVNALSAYLQDWKNKFLPGKQVTFPTILCTFLCTRKAQFPIKFRNFPSDTRISQE